MSTDLAKSRMERILRLHDQIDEIKGDIREVYAEEKSAGGDKTAMGAAISIIRKRAKDQTTFQEREDMKNVYLHAFDAPIGTRLATHTHAPEASGSSNGRTPEFDSGNGGSNPSPETINPETGEITEPETQSEQPCTATGPSASTGNASDEIPANNSPSAVSARTVDETAEPAVAKPQPRAVTADQFSRAPVESVPLHEQADVKIAGSYPREARAGASGEGQRRPPNEVEPGPHSLSPSAGYSSLPSSLAGEVGKSSLTSPAFSNPRCRKPNSCHYAHSRDCCRDCLLAWGSKPRDEQCRLWQEAERAAREREAAA